MIDFDREWSAATARIKRARRWTAFVGVVVVAMHIAAVAGALWVVVAIVRAGPESIGAAAGNAVAAFERGRNGQ